MSFCSSSFLEVCLCAGRFKTDDFGAANGNRRERPNFYLLWCDDVEDRNTLSSIPTIGVET